MTGGRWARTETLVWAAVQLPADERAAFLDAECGDDAELRDEIDSLLAREARAESFLGVAGLRGASGLAAGAGATPVEMMLDPGTKLGPYRIDAFVGAGGMGAVYRATDTRLGRTVAIKILTARAASDLDRHRLEREARSASALNHPHICTVHDIGTDRGTAYLVMEYLDGETLAARLVSRGALPLAQAIDIATQVAGALGAAHRAGIVHRDLKPGNIMLVKPGPGRSGQSHAKLLDFGLARSVDPAGREPEPDSVRAAGLVVGTAPYMAPEQLTGRVVDARTDLFAFGAVLYEMVSGRRAFDSDSQAGAIAAVLEHEPPPIADARPLTPPALDRLIRKCLEKDPEARWQSASDVADELAWIAEGQGMPAQRPRHGRLFRRAWVQGLILLLVAAAGTTAGWLARRVPGPQSLHLSVTLADLELSPGHGGVAISPDGRTLAFVARRGDSQPMLYVRRLDDEEPQGIKGTTGAVAPFFSPDGRWLAFAADAQLVKVRVDGSDRQVLCPIAYQGLTRGHWTPSGHIVFSHWPGGLSSVPASGGSARTLIASSTQMLLWPQLLPGEDVLLFTAVDHSKASVVAKNLVTGVQHTIVADGSCGRYLPTGHLVYASGRTLRAVAFDPVTLRMSGESRAVFDDVAIGYGTVGMSLGDFDISPTGTLAALQVSNFLRHLVWRGRDGGTAPLRVEARDYTFPSLSPDGRWFTVTVNRFPATSVWVGSVEGEPLRELPRRGRDICGIFSKDGRSIAFASDVNGWSDLFVMEADGEDQPRPVIEEPNHHKPTCWSRDGRWVLFNDNESGPWQRDIMRVDVASREIEPVLRTEANELEAVLSPDERWMAYQSDASGRWEVYVRRYPGPGGLRQVSSGGGKGPVWNPRGGELFYQTHTSLMSVPFRDDTPSPPVRLFASAPSNDYRREFDVTPDGKRFLFVEPATSRDEITVVVNWLRQVETIVPAK